MVYHLLRRLDDLVCASKERVARTGTGGRGSHMLMEGPLLTLLTGRPRTPAERQLRRPSRAASYGGEYGQ